MRDKLDYFISILDLNISQGKSPDEALAEAVRSYAFVYHDKDQAGTKSNGERLSAVEMWVTNFQGFEERLKTLEVKRK